MARDYLDWSAARSVGKDDLSDWDVQAPYGLRDGRKVDVSDFGQVLSRADARDRALFYL